VRGWKSAIFDYCSKAQPHLFHPSFLDVPKMIFNEALLLSLLGLWNKKLKEKRK